MPFGHNDRKRLPHDGNLFYCTSVPKIQVYEVCSSPDGLLSLIFF